MYDENIVSGYEDGTFKPDNSVTRAEAVTMMNKVLDNPIAENAENPFGDVSPNHWAYNQIRPQYRESSGLSHMYNVG